MRLSQKRFFQILAARATSYGFRLDSDGWIREKRTKCCPVTAVVRALGQRGFEDYQFEAAAKSIGLNTAFADRVACAADKCGRYDPAIRRRLMRAVGIKS
jgi:hypothetical protein